MQAYAKSVETFNVWGKESLKEAKPLLGGCVGRKTKVKNRGAWMDIDKEFFDIVKLVRWLVIGIDDEMSRM